MGETRLDHEMITPALGAPFFSEHLARYHFATKFAKSLSVLDVACGRGYGSMALATVANKVTGVDLDDDNLSFAQKYYSHPRIHYKKVDVTKLGDSPDKFDLLVAFEVIEHLPPEESERFIEALSQCLHPGGLALISTPNHDVVRASGVPVPHFHINNLSSVELQSQMQLHFEKVTMYGQIRSKGPIGNILYGLDVFHLRHKLLPFRSKFSSAPSMSSVSTVEPPLYWRPEQGWGDSKKFIFSTWLWRQAGLTLAIGQKGAKANE